MNTTTQDAALILQLGGPSKVAALIAIDKRGGAQRVQNWMVRGIPSAIKVKYPHIFMPELAQPGTSIAQVAIKTVAPKAPENHDANHDAAGPAGLANCQVSTQGV